MKSAFLADVCDITMGQAPSGDTYNDAGHGLPLVAGAGDFGELYPAPKKFTAARNVRVSEPGDIIVGIRASIGDKVWADQAYCLGRGVAGLRARDALDQNYLWHWITLSASRLAAKGRGATFLQVNKRDISEMEIPLPPIAEQRRIAAVLDAADALRAKRRLALAKLDTLSQAIFIDMFGPPGTNPGRYPVSTMIELVDPRRPITYGILKPGEDLPDGIPYVRVVDLVDGSVNAAALRRTSPGISAQYKRSLVAEGDLLLSIRGHVGRLAVVDGDAAGANITQDTARLAVLEADPIYVLECLRSAAIQRWMATFTKGAAVRGINLTDVKKIPIPLPPADQQRRFAEVARAVLRERSSHRRSASELEVAFASLQQRAFRGEL